jgi:acyl-CoA synthetase (AMP-forming)/AMP-acid ligase II
VIDAAGYVSIVGRAKDLIICGGFNVYPAEVEALIDAIPGIAESAVIGMPHPDMGEGVVAVVQARDPALDEAAVLAALQGSWPASSSRAGWSSCPNCRATPWARSRKRPCARLMPISLP